MEFVECRAKDTICIGQRLRLTVMATQRDSVTLAVLASSDSELHFTHGKVRREAIDPLRVHYLLPLLDGDTFSIDDVRIGVGVYFDRREIEDNDDCDVQLQISAQQPMSIQCLRAQHATAKALSDTCSL